MDSVSRVTFGTHTTVSQRHVNTPYEVKNVPPFSPSDVRYTPSRKEFIQDSLVKAIICYFVIDAVGLNGAPENASVLFGQSRVPVFARFVEISGEEIALRIFTALFLWMTIFCMIRMFYGVVSLAAVLLGWYDV